MVMREHATQCNSVTHWCVFGQKCRWSLGVRFWLWLHGQICLTVQPVCSSPGLCWQFQIQISKKGSIYYCSKHQLHTRCPSQHGKSTRDENSLLGGSFSFLNTQTCLLAAQWVRLTHPTHLLPGSFSKRRQQWVCSSHGNTCDRWKDGWQI